MDRDLAADCVHITDQGIAKDDAYIIVNKELARVDQKAIAALGEQELRQPEEKQETDLQKLLTQLQENPELAARLRALLKAR